MFCLGSIANTVTTKLLIGPSEQNKVSISCLLSWCRGQGGGKDLNERWRVAVVEGWYAAVHHDLFCLHLVGNVALKMKRNDFAANLGDGILGVSQN